MDADPEFDTKRAHRKLRRYVESNDHAIRLKAEIMVDHFHEQVSGLNKTRRRSSRDGGHQWRRARDPVLPPGFEATCTSARARYEAIVAFSGEHEYHGSTVTEASLNGLPVERHPRQDSGAPLPLPGRRRTSSRPATTSRCCTRCTSISRSQASRPSRRCRVSIAPTRRNNDAFILDFLNDSDGIEFAFSDYYRTTILSGETDPNKLHDLTAALKTRKSTPTTRSRASSSCISPEPTWSSCTRFLDACLTRYKDDLDEDGQVGFKGNAKAFRRTYGFLSSILPYTNAEWEKLSIFLNFLIPKLPAPEEDDLSKGILETSIWTATASRSRRGRDPARRR